MTLHSKGGRRCMAVLSTSLKSCRRVHLLCFPPEAECTPENCAHCNSMVVRLLRFCGVPFLPRLLPNFFLEQLAQASSSFVQLRLRITHRTSHDVRNLVVLVTLDVVEHKHCPVARGQFFDGTLQIDPVDRTAQAKIRRANVFPG